MVQSLTPLSGFFTPLLSHADLRFFAFDEIGLMRGNRMVFTEDEITAPATVTVLIFGLNYFRQERGDYATIAQIVLGGGDSSYRFIWDK